MNIPLTPEYIPSEKEPLPPELWPKVDHLITEDGKPVDSMYSEKQMRLLTEPLYSSWAGPGGNQPFLVAATVGFFYQIKTPPIVPDVLLSAEVQAPQDLFPKSNRSYFLWEYGKPPEAVIEIVSNKEGGELSEKLRIYAYTQVLYYVVWDPEMELSKESLQAFVLREKKYERLDSLWFPGINLGLTLWTGNFEEVQGLWLRWCDQNGRVIPTGKERGDQEKQRADQEMQRAEQEKQRAEQEKQRADRLAAQLRAMGVNLPEGNS
jgi:hypothetical protein